METPSHGRVASNTVIYLMAQILSWASSLISISIIPRVLGETGMGQMALASTYVGQIALILTLSIDQYLATECGRDRAQTQRLLSATLGLRLVCIPLMFAATATSLYVAHVSHVVWLLGLQLMLGAAVGYLLGPMRWILAGWEDARSVARNDLMITFIQLLALPFLRFGVVIYSLASLIAGQPANIVTTLAVKKHVRLRPSFDLTLWREILKGSLGFLVNDMIAPLFALATVSILKHHTDEATVGVYAMSQRLLGTFMFVPNALGIALLPSLARLADADRAQFQRMQQRVLVAMIVAGLPIVLMAFQLADPFCHLLFSKEKFLALPLAVKLSGLCVIPLYITTMLYRFLVAERKNSIWCYFLAGTLVIQAALCALLVPYTLNGPWHNGTLGAILATAVAETCTVICAFALLRANPFNGEMATRLCRAAIAAAAMSATMWLTRGLFFVFTALLGIAVFALLIWKLEALGAEDQAKIAELVTNRFRKRRTDR